MLLLETILLTWTTVSVPCAAAAGMWYACRGRMPKIGRLPSDSLLQPAEGELIYELLLNGTPTGERLVVATAAEIHAETERRKQAGQTYGARLWRADQ
jgi:hypothetical protein